MLSTATGDVKLLLAGIISESRGDCRWERRQ
jgi:hypothetical protein